MLGKKILGYTVQKGYRDYYVVVNKKNISGSTVEEIEGKLKAYLEAYKEQLLKVGDKVIIAKKEGYRSEVNIERLTIETIVSIRKRTYKTNSGFVLDAISYNGDVIDYNKSGSFYETVNSRYLQFTCDISGEKAHPSIVRLWTEKRMKEWTKMAQDNILKENIKQAAYAQEKRMKEEHQNEAEKLELKLARKLQRMFVDGVCSKCRFFVPDMGTCKKENRIEYGVLKKSDYCITSCRYVKPIIDIQVGNYVDTGAKKKYSIGRRGVVKSVDYNDKGRTTIYLEGGDWFYLENHEHTITIFDSIDTVLKGGKNG